MVSKMTKAIIVLGSPLVVAYIGISLAIPPYAYPSRSIGAPFDGHWNSKSSNGCFTRNPYIRFSGNKLYHNLNGPEAVFSIFEKMHYENGVWSVRYRRLSTGSIITEKYRDLGNELITIEHYFKRKGEKKFIKGRAVGRSWVHCSKTSIFGKILLRLRLVTPIRGI